MERAERGKKKAGRPLQAVKKEVKASVRYTRSEYFAIREKASKAGLKASEYIRQITLSGQVKSRLTEEERTVARQLVGMANNLNQLAKTCHQQGLLSAMVYFESYRDSLDEVLRKLKL